MYYEVLSCTPSLTHPKAVICMNKFSFMKLVHKYIWRFRIRTFFEEQKRSSKSILKLLYQALLICSIGAFHERTKLLVSDQQWLFCIQKVFGRRVEGVWIHLSNKVFNLHLFVGEQEWEKGSRAKQSDTNVLYKYCIFPFNKSPKAPQHTEMWCIPTKYHFHFISESEMKTIQSTEVKEIHQKYLFSIPGVPSGQSWLSLNSPFSQTSFYRIHCDVLNKKLKSLSHKNSDITCWSTYLPLVYEFPIFVSYFIFFQLLQVETNKNPSVFCVSYIVFYWLKLMLSHMCLWTNNVKVK